MYCNILLGLRRDGLNHDTEIVRGHGPHGAHTWQTGLSICLDLKNIRGTADGSTILRLVTGTVPPLASRSSCAAGTLILSWKSAGLYPYYWSPCFGFPSEQAPISRRTDSAAATHEGVTVQCRLSGPGKLNNLSGYAAKIGRRRKWGLSQNLRHLPKV